MSHSNQIREFAMTSEGIELRDVYIGPLGVLSGSARLAQEAQERADVALIDEAPASEVLLEHHRQEMAHSRMVDA